jgi:stage III sporulation protein AH
MKPIIKKNQLIVTSLALMIAVAGYLNFSYGTDEEELAVMAEQGSSIISDAADSAMDAVASLTENEILTNTAAQEEYGDESAGETVLTGSSSVAVSKAASLKMDREQTRAANQAVLMEVINNTALTEEEKKSAIDGLAQMTDIAQREAACELLLESKGFEEAIVSLSSEGADVIINATELSDAQRAQIEDVIQRKGNVDPAEIVISTMDF